MTPLAVKTRHDLTVELPDGIDLRYEGLSVDSKHVYDAIDLVEALLEELRRIAGIPPERVLVEPRWTPRLEGVELQEGFPTDA